jgi:hypothetical protein
VRAFTVKTIFLFVICPLAITAPPNCETKRVNGTDIETCSRWDTECDSLAAEQVKHPSDQWNGCSWPVTITRGSYTAVGLTMYDTTVMVVPHFKDSEKVDIQVIFENSYCGAKLHEFKNQQITVHDGVPYATAGFTCGQYPSEVKYLR